MSSKRRKKSIVVIGAGINGLVAANYLQRHGFQVTLIERNERVGGACTSAILRYRGANIFYPPGASVLGMMQEFVFEETGLSQEIEIATPNCPEMVYFNDCDEPFFSPDLEHARGKQALKRWGETGRVAAFGRDLDKVVAFLRKRYRAGLPPTLREAEAMLGRQKTALWITGSARRLLDHYFTSDRLKIFYAMSVTESGPVSLHAPYSAFSIPLMASGGVFDGKWGFVKGGIWNVTAALHRINKKLGVRIITSARATVVSASNGRVRYMRQGRTREICGDKIIFATDPLSAAKLLRDRALVAKILSMQLQGSSGKLVMIFKRPVRWTDENGDPDFHWAFRYIVMNTTLDEFERSSAGAEKW